MEPSTTPRLRGAALSILYAFDAGRSIDLEEARRHVRDRIEPSELAHKRYAPTYFQFEPPPLRVVQPSEPLVIAGRTVAPHAECALFAFGAVSIRYDLPFEGTLEDLVEVSVAIGRTTELADAARRRAEELIEAVRPAIEEPAVAGTVEDYVLIRVEEVEGTLEDLLARHGATIARILGATESFPAQEEVDDLVEHRTSFARDDLVVVDWNAALVVGHDMDDVADVLEFANLQLLEMRFLDQRLDEALGRAYETTSRAVRKRWPRISEPDLERVGRMQVDAAVLFERVGNALKLLGDQWLARVHRLAVQRFHLAEWNASIFRKLDTLEGIYQKMFDRASARRMETLEWLIIALIAISMLIPFL